MGWERGATIAERSRHGMMDVLPSVYMTRAIRGVHFDGRKRLFLWPIRSRSATSVTWVVALARGDSTFYEPDVLTRERSRRGSHFEVVGINRCQAP